MPVTLHPVSSSYCDAIGYDEAQDDLHVQWKNGKVSIYHPVTPAEYRSVVGAASVGRAVIQIKKTKGHRYA